ncbi:PREDICTED: uncharacterized protein LOC108376054 [Rhagoletis zephyria]|uniref:uncharacterized protein LOC108376054 n=1 Tax=Rhagoletis zephyria TaxID=28612 RepID=UPI0008116048|nr:PREDICTED: uncharacterized protein LOC108376054 [Rhagoletis zephyria]
MSDDRPSTSASARNSQKGGEWNFARMVLELRTHEQGAQFAVEHGLIRGTMLCPFHKVRMNWRKGGKFGYFVCQRGKCAKRPRISVAAATWFEGVRISVPHVYYLMYCFVENFTREMILRQDYVKEGKTLSSATITDWYSYCREVVVIYQLDHQEATGKIGGPGKIVQIDKSEFGKRKLNKGRGVEGHWVLGMIQDGSEDLRLEVCPDNCISENILIPLIKKHVAEGSIIRTDFFSAHDCLSENGFIAEDGTHSQRIQSQWRVVKRFFSARNYNHTGNFADMVVEYLWRRNIKKTKKDPFLALVEAINYVYKLELK